MHDPDTLILSIGPVTLWHHDPCKDGTDDSCGWFKRARHGDKDVLKKIERDILFDWNCAYQPLFTDAGDPALSTIGITLNMFFHGAYRVFGESRRRAMRWMHVNLCEILIFAENPVDTLATAIQGKYGENQDKKEDRARQMAAVVYGWILRSKQHWWQKPAFHIHHWRLTCRPFWRRA